uniref:Uncharacterized protein n=1 Tax=Cannabis sativa TaxID=3483 RepID=A0A803QC84_CANSA
MTTNHMNTNENNGTNSGGTSGTLIVNSRTAPAKAWLEKLDASSNCLQLSPIRPIPVCNDVGTHAMLKLQEGIETKLVVHREFLLANDARITSYVANPTSTIARLTATDNLVIPTNITVVAATPSNQIAHVNNSNIVEGGIDQENLLQALCMIEQHRKPIYKLHGTSSFTEEMRQAQLSKVFRLSESLKDKGSTNPIDYLDKFNTIIEVD